MNEVERLVYDFVKRNPRLKRYVRDIYQRIWDLFPLERSASESKYPIEVREGFFFGFHDKCPWSADDKQLLGHRYTIPLRMPTPDETVEVGYFCGPEYAQYVSVGHTRAWNWHQGAMLQWLGETPNIVFNDFDGAKHVARIVDLQGIEQSVLPLPVSAISPDGTKAASYSFSRLRGSPYGYAYANGIDPEADRLVPKQHGLHLVDILTGETRMLLSVADVASIEPASSMKGAFHFFSHCQFSPSGNRLKFFHRWEVNGNQKWTRMFSCDIDGANLHLFPTTEMVSHVGWRDNDHLVAYARTADHGDHYYLFKDRTSQFEIIGEEAFSSDGHPSFSKDGRWLLTDTYPNRARMRTLILYDTLTKRRHDLAKLYSPRQFVGKRVSDLISCDLHPRWSRRNDMICFDSAHTGKRALCFINLGDSLVELGNL